MASLPDVRSHSVMTEHALMSAYRHAFFCVCSFMLGAWGTSHLPELL